MASSIALLALSLLAPLAVSADPSPKRGLCYVPSKYTSDDNFWDNSTGDLTWYYNYKALPSDAYKDSDLQFVPMQWGAVDNPTTDMSFYNTVKGLINDGHNITYVLGMNEPDGCFNGGSCLDAMTAAQMWKTQFEPLKRDFGIQLGAPAVTGAPTGFTWLQNWFSACAAISDNNTSCIVDFIPTHWYGDFQGLASHLGRVNGTYKNISSMWVTEFALPEAKLADTESFYNQTIDWLDDLSWVSHYSWFGAFRSDVSNVGPNAAFLTQKGKLTNIGSWYMGGDATGEVPKGSASTTAKFAGWSIFIVGATVWSLL